MTKIRSLRTLYNKGGLKLIVGDTTEYILMQSVVAPYFKMVLGKPLHQKLFSYRHLGYWPNIENPQSFNEKIIHRKLYTNNEIFSIVEDKSAVRDYVASKVGSHILPDVYQITDDPSTIRFQSLPEKYVVKPTHMSGPVILIKDSDMAEVDTIQDACYEWLTQTYGNAKEEYWYQKIDPQIIVEEYLSDKNGNVPDDYKFFTFNGRVEYIQVDTDRFTDHKRRFYDRNWEPQEFKLKYPLAPPTKEPKNLGKMISIAEQLGSEFDFIRVDLYQPDNNRVVFGEMTVAHGSGIERFSPQKYDFILGKMW